MYLRVILLALLALPVWAQGMVGNVGISASSGVLWITPTINAAFFQGDGSQLTNINATYPQNVSITNLTVSNSTYGRNVSSTVVSLISSTLPTCNAGTNRTLRINSVNQLCYCNATEWRDVAPPAVTVLGISVLSFTTCSP